MHLSDNDRSIIHLALVYWQEKLLHDANLAKHDNKDKAWDRICRQKADQIDTLIDKLFPAPALD